MKHDVDLLNTSTPEFERRVRAVVVADVVGYTRLMEADEEETHARYRTLRVAVVDPLIVSHRGELVKNTGDGFVAVFESPLDAIRSAIELQQEIAAQEARQAPERRICFRIGIHWDPVILDFNDVYGRGVNIAVRLQTVAPAGGIVVSSGLLSQIGNLRDLKLDDLGDVRLKNLSRPVHAFAVILPGVDRSAAAAPAKSSGWARLPSIAVLPFKNLSPNPDDSYFAEGFVEDIIVTLGNIPELLVVSRGSTLAFRRGVSDPGKVGEKLGVQYYLSGGIRRSGDRPAPTSSQSSGICRNRICSLSRTPGLIHLFTKSAMSRSAAITTVAASGPTRTSRGRRNRADRKGLRLSKISGRGSATAVLHPEASILGASHWHVQTAPASELYGRDLLKLEDH